MGKLWKLFGAYEVLIVLTIIVTKSDKPSPNAWQNGYELKAKMHFILASLVRKWRQFIDKIAPYSSRIKSANIVAKYPANDATKFALVAKPPSKNGLGFSDEANN